MRYADRLQLQDRHLDPRRQLWGLLLNLHQLDAAVGGHLDLALPESAIELNLDNHGKRISRCVQLPATPLPRAAACRARGFA